MKLAASARGATGDPGYRSSTPCRGCDRVISASDRSGNFAEEDPYLRVDVAPVYRDTELISDGARCVLVIDANWDAAARPLLRASLGACFPGLVSAASGARTGQQSSSPMKDAILTAARWPRWKTEGASDPSQSPRTVR